MNLHHLFLRHSGARVEIIDIVERFLNRGPCDLVIVAGTTATFGYIIDWALRASADGGELIEINPEETALSRFATKIVREPAAIALPRLINSLWLGVAPPNRLTERSH